MVELLLALLERQFYLHYLVPRETLATYFCPGFPACLVLKQKPKLEVIFTVYKL